MLTVFDGSACVTTVQKRLKEILINAKTARVLFVDQLTKELEIP
jgi:hypothetical protein